MELGDVIEQAKRKGFTKKEINSLLLNRGYSQAEIDKELYPGRSGSKGFGVGSGGAKGYFDNIEKFKMLFSDPQGFFGKVREPNIGGSILLFVIVSLLVGLVSFGFQFILARSLFGSRFGFSYFGIGFSFLITGVTMTFVFSGIVHTVVKIFHGKGSYVDSYNIVTYSLVPAAVLSLIPIIGILSFIYSIVLMTFGISIVHKIDKGKAVVAALMPMILLIGLVGFLVLWFFFAFAGGF